jgi:hypothetical protein
MPENIINPDVVCQQLMQAQLELYRAEENLAAKKKVFSDCVQGAGATIQLMKARILEQEEEARKKGPEKKKE